VVFYISIVRKGTRMQSFIQSVRFKIILAFGVCVTLMAVIGLFGIFGLSRMNSNIRDSYSGNTLPIAWLSEVRAAQLDIRVKMRRLEASRNVDAVAEAVADIRADLAETDRNWTAYYPAGVTSDEERLIADRINAELTRLRPSTSTIAEAFVEGNFDAAVEEIHRSVDVANAVANDLRADAANNLAQAKQVLADSESSYSTMLRWLIALVSAGSVMAVGASIYLTRAIATPLGRAVDVANEIASGGLDNHIAVHSRDEFGQLLEALKKMDGMLSKTVRNIMASADTVMSASQEIASGNTDLSARTEQQAASLEETAASMTQLTQTVRQNSDNARTANTLAIRATDMAGAGNDAVLAMLHLIGEVSSSSERITQITGVIEGIAFQTNILALNAAVESARAGDQGRGFAVVASEVRSLAQRSAEAAKAIKELIASSVAMIQSSVSQAKEVGATMGNVQQAIQQVSAIVGEIAVASEEQSRGIEQVHQALSHIDEVTQQNATLVEEAAAAAQSLEQQAQVLKEGVTVFKVADAPDAIVRTVPFSLLQPAAAAVRKASVMRTGPAPAAQADRPWAGSDAATATEISDRWEMV